MIFVFGSNLQGIHGAGAAKIAREKYGAIYGRGVGIQGNSYAIPTKDHFLKTLPIAEIKPYVAEFIKFAKENSDLRFYLTPIGCGLAGHDPKEIRKIFVDCGILTLNNIVLAPSWLEHLGKS